ncbi:MAG: hypothetical protein ACM3SR_16025 [Ignavibacteriales bacterium]
MNNMKIALLMILVSTTTFGEEIWKSGECALLSTRDIGKICKDQPDGVISNPDKQCTCHSEPKAKNL